jgi:hypothetical protein
MHQGMLSRHGGWQAEVGRHTTSWHGLESHSYSLMVGDLTHPQDRELVEGKEVCRKMIQVM